MMSVKVTYKSILVLFMAVLGCARFNNSEYTVPRNILDSNLQKSEYTLVVYVTDVIQTKLYRDDLGKVGIVEYRVRANIVNVVKSQCKLGKRIDYYFTREFDPNTSVKKIVGKKQLVFLKTIDNIFWCVNETSQFDVLGDVENWLKQIQKQKNI